MKPLTRDITVTLVVKLSLLIILWLVCVRGIERPAQYGPGWMLGSSVSGSGKISKNS